MSVLDKKRWLIVDNYDSFTYNLVHLVEKILQQEVEVRFNDAISVDEAAAYDRIILSPGPGLPDEAGIMKALIRQLSPFKPILGVCLGHQAIGEVFGATLFNLPQVFHGCTGQLLITDMDEPLFKEVPQASEVGRYHSWVIGRNDFPEVLKVTATDSQGNIMAIRHKLYDVCGVQFHPESVMTPCGEKIISNWLFH